MTQIRRLLLLALLFLLLNSCVGAAEEGLILHYSFDKSAPVQDLSGSGHDGKINGAVWAPGHDGGALRFDGANAHVDLGSDPALNITGDITVAAWVKLEATAYPTNDTNWVIISNEEFTRHGFILRVEGATGQLYYRANGEKKYGNVLSRNPIQNHRYYHVAFVKKGRMVTLYVDGLPDGSKEMDDPDPSTGHLCISAASQAFEGLMDDFRIFNRALRGEEVFGLYKASAETFGKDTSGFGKIALKHYYYPHRNEMLVQANFLGVMPLLPEDELSIELVSQGGSPVDSRILVAIPESGLGEYTFKLDQLPPGNQQVRAVLSRQGDTVSESVIRFQYPLPPTNVPSPEQTAVAPVPKPATSAFKLTPGPGGGFTIGFKGEEFAVESLFSYPDGGENSLTSGVPAGEPSWVVNTRKLDAETWQVTGEGRFYRIDRRIRLNANRVSVTDRISNKRSYPVGIILSNSIVSTKGFTSGLVAGNGVTGEIGNVDTRPNPTVFVQSANAGLGLVALDDLYVLQSLGSYGPKRGALGSNTFALDAGKSYTLEWAVYPTGSGDYYDFINEVRRDEKRNFVTVEGGFAFIPRGEVPDEEWVKLRNLKYFTLGCLSYSTDDPTLSIEGVEFMDFPKEMEVVRNQFARAKEKYPYMDFGFHIAHNLYATDKPDRFPDSKVIRADGTQSVWGATDDYYYSSKYFSKEKLDDNWRWWIYYPTRENSFGKAMLDSVDVMMDEMGATSCFMDGFFWDYYSFYTYDRWDGHTAEIDPKTKRITRKMANTLLLSQPLLVDYARKVRSKGGTVIANNCYPTRTICSEYMVHDKELTEGPYVHLLPTVSCLGSASYSSEADLWQDILNKLRWGNLYFYYGEGDLVKHQSAPSQMYPITVEEIHSGYVKGRERLVTMHSGVYGWRGAFDLHFGYHYDARGYWIPNSFLSTIDESGVRTKVDLKDKEVAILKRVPVYVRTSTRTNVLCRQYDSDAIRFTLNGNGRTEVSVETGDFAIKPGTVYTVKTGNTSAEIKSDSKGLLSFPVSIRGETEVVISK